MVYWTFFGIEELPVCHLEQHLWVIENTSLWCDNLYYLSCCITQTFTHFCGTIWWVLALERERSLLYSVNVFVPKWRWFLWGNSKGWWGTFCMSITCACHARMWCLVWDLEEMYVLLVCHRPEKKRGGGPTEGDVVRRITGLQRLVLQKSYVEHTRMGWSHMVLQLILYSCDESGPNVTV